MTLNNGHFGKAILDSDRVIHYKVGWFCFLEKLETAVLINVTKMY